jgi:hypothetical protein
VLFNTALRMTPTPDLSALIDDLDKLVEGRPDDTRAVLMRGELRTLLALSRWAVEAKEALDELVGRKNCENDGSGAIASKARSSFPSIQ